MIEQFPQDYEPTNLTDLLRKTDIEWQQLGTKYKYLRENYSDLPPRSYDLPGIIKQQAALIIDLPNKIEQLQIHGIEVSDASVVQGIERAQFAKKQLDLYTTGSASAAAVRVINEPRGRVQQQDPRTFLEKWIDTIES